MSRRLDGWCIGQLGIRTVWHVVQTAGPLLNSGIPNKKTSLQRSDFVQQNAANYKPTNILFKKKILKINKRKGLRVAAIYETPPEVAHDHPLGSGWGWTGMPKKKKSKKHSENWLSSFTQFNDPPPIIQYCPILTPSNQTSQGSSIPVLLP
jgi:hypothetical protein